jgi:hypothetical protein
MACGAPEPASGIGKETGKAASRSTKTKTLATIIA